MEVVEVIKLTLAPAVMVNCCGLFLLGMNNKYSVVVGRIRTLNEEKRKLSIKKNDQIQNEFDEKRFHSIQMQTGKLLYRLQLVRNAVISYSVAVAFFVLTCILIGLDFTVSQMHISNRIFNILFFSGLVCVFFGIFFATREVIKGYQIVKIEVEDF